MSSYQLALPTNQLLAIVPKPTKAVILLFPDVPEAKAHQKEEDEKIARDGQPHLDPTVFYVKQTVSSEIASSSRRLQ